MTSGKQIVIDTSALLAVYFAEPSAMWVSEQLEAHVGAIQMSTVNAAEVLMISRDRRPATIHEIEAQLISSGIRFVPPTIEHARQAAEARHRFPFNLGDCFAYALAVTENASILTLDEDFRRCGRPILIPD